MPKSNFRLKIRIRRQIRTPEAGEIHKTNNALTEQEISNNEVPPPQCHNHDLQCVTFRIANGRGAQLGWGENSFCQKEIKP